MELSDYGSAEPERQASEPEAGDDRATLPAHDTRKAVAFFVRLISAGRLAVAAIDPRTGACHGETFTLPFEHAQLSAWIKTRQGRFNLYFSPNEPVHKDQQRGKAGRLCAEDVERLRFVVLDLDPRWDVESQPGGFDRERVRLDAQAREWRGDGAAGPTAIVDSGNGVQAFWKLRSALRATPANRAAVEAQSRGLARLYGGDRTHSVEHLFRIPWTVNLPDRRKRAKGRKAAPTRGKVIEPERLYDLADLARIATPVPAEDGLGTTDLPDVMSALGVLGAPENLDADLAERLAEARAERPVLDRMLSRDEPPGDRSEHDFALAAAGVEAGFTDPEDLAHIVAAYSPWKTEDRGTPYLARTVAKALKRTKPKPASNGADFFETVGVEEGGAEPLDVFGDDDPAKLSTPPAGSLPSVVERYMRIEAQRNGVPESFPAVAAVTALGGALGGRLRLQVREHSADWLVPGALAVVVVARPGRRKSPTINAALAPHRKIQRELNAANARARSAWEAVNRTSRGTLSTHPKTPAPPVRQLLVDDATLEKQVQIQADNPYGTLRTPDELVAFLASFGAYKRNGDGDRSHMLKMLDGSSISLDRVRGSVHAETALMGILASTQPDRIRLLARDLGSDGMLQRFLFLLDDEIERPALDVPVGDVLAEYESAVRALHAIDQASGGVVQLSPEARAVLSAAWAQIRALDRLPGASAAWQGHISKWEGLLYRIVLVFHALDLWDRFGFVPVEVPVDADTAGRAIRFVRFLLRHAWAFYREFHEPEASTVEARKVASYLLTRPEITTVRPRDVEKAVRSLASNRRLTLAAMRDLEVAAWVSVAEYGADGSSKWAINPAVHTRFAVRAEREKKRRKGEHDKVLAAIAARQALSDED